jgi:hypothetical protein
VAPRLLGHQFEHQVHLRLRAILEHGVAAHDVGVLAQAYPGIPLRHAALAGGGVGQVRGLKGLERDRALLLVVEAEVDEADAAKEGPAGDFVTVGDAGAGGVEIHAYCSLCVIAGVESRARCGRRSSPARP